MLHWLPQLPFSLDPLIGEAKRRARRRRLALAGAFLLVAAAVAIVAVKAAAEPSSSLPSVGTSSPLSHRVLASSTGCTSGSRPAVGKYPADANGDGKITDSGNERIPALVAAVGDRGRAGYVKATDAFCTAAPVSPAAALAAQEKPRQIPVYAANGTTVVDILTIKPASP